MKARDVARRPVWVSCSTASDAVQVNSRVARTSGTSTITPKSNDNGYTEL